MEVTTLLASVHFICEFYNCEARNIRFENFYLKLYQEYCQNLYFKKTEKREKKQYFRRRKCNKKNFPTLINGFKCSLLQRTFFLICKISTVIVQSKLKCTTRKINFSNYSRLKCVNESGSYSSYLPIHPYLNDTIDTEIRKSS